MDSVADDVVACVFDVLNEMRASAPKLGRDTPLREVLDSFQRVLLVARLEKKLGVRFLQSDLAKPDDWDSCASIATLVTRARKRKANAV
jgi:acyl carrier protein